MVLAKLEADLYAVLCLHVEEDLPICAAGAQAALASQTKLPGFARVAERGGGLASRRVFGP